MPEAKKTTKVTKTTKTAKTTAKETVKKAEEKIKDVKNACPLNCSNICEKSDAVAAKIKEFILANYKKPVFIITSVIIALLILCSIFCCDKQVKLHFTGGSIIKEVINGHKSSYYFCKRDFPEGEIEKNKFYISCDKQVVEK